MWRFLAFLACALGSIGFGIAQGVNNPTLPAGSNTQIQRNSSGVFGADSGLVYNGSLFWLGGGASNLFPAADGTAGSTQVDHMFRNNVTSNQLSVGTFQNTSNVGFSAIRFADDAGVEHGAVGWGNSGTSATWKSAVFLESFLPAASGNNFAPIFLVQSNSNTHSNTVVLSGSKEWWWVAEPVSTVGNVIGVRANSTSFASNASANSSLFRLEQLGNSSAVLVYAPSPGNGGSTITNTDGMIRAHIEGTSSTAPIIAVRQDGSGDWFQGQAGSNTVAFAVNPNAGSPILYLGQKTSSFPALKRSSTAMTVRLGDDSADAPLTASAITASGILSTSNTTDATAAASGSLQAAGGASIAKRVFLPGLTASSGLQTAVLCLSSGNEVIADSVACLASSERFKEDIAPSKMGLETVLAMKPINYRYRPTGNDRFDAAPNQRAEQVGFLAEQAMAVDTRLVAVDAEGNPRTFRYENYVAVLTKAIQEQQAQIEELKKQISERKP